MMVLEETETGKADREAAVVDRQAAAADRDSAALLFYQASVLREAAAHDREQAALLRHQAALDRAAAGTDELTGALRRRVGFPALQREMDRCRRSGTNLVIGFVDVDAMKEVNDTRGHQAGDQVLRDVALGLRAFLRSYDIVVRFGGDEFVFSLAGAGLRDVSARFDMMRASLGYLLRGSISAGFAEFRPHDTLEALIARADADLYDRRGAARDGRHPIVVGDGSAPGLVETAQP